jgi:hypothetical protein
MQSFMHSQPPPFSTAKTKLWLFEIQFILCFIYSCFMPWSLSNPYIVLIEGIGGKEDRVDVGAGAYLGCLDFEVRTFAVYGFSSFGGRNYEGGSDESRPSNDNCSSVVQW